MIYPPIAIVGESGSGKSFSIRNLPPDSTLILNIEKKFLPFTNAKDFKNSNLFIAATAGTPIVLKFEQELDKAIANKNVKYIVIDSFYFYLEYLLAQAKLINKGWDIFNFYNDKVFALLEKLKNIEDKWLILIATPEILAIMSADGSQSSQKRIFVQGKKFEGKIEHHFGLVFFTVVKQPDKTKPAVYSLLTNSDGLCTAKTPDGMFRDREIPNDLLLITKNAENYWGLI